MEYESRLINLPASFSLEQVYCLEREPEVVRVEFGRGERPGLASFQVFTSTLHINKISIVSTS